MLNKSWKPPSNFGLANAVLYTIDLDPADDMVADVMSEINEIWTIDGLDESGPYS